MSSNKISLLLIDMQILFIEGLTSLLTPTQFEIIGAFTDPIEGLQAFKKLLPDITIISECMSNFNTITLVQEMILYNKQAKILILATKLSDFTVIETIKVGVMGFISRTNSIKILEKALLNIYHNQPYYCDLVSQILARNLTVDKNPTSHIDIFKKLTNREKEIMIALLDGMSINDIANSLHISRKTVTTHKSKVYKKFNLNNMIEFVKLGNELGF